MKIEFDRYSSEALDEIFIALLIEDWHNVRDEVKRLKKRLKDDTINVSYKKTLEEDLKDSKKVRNAYETVLRYCLSYERAKELLGEEKCKESGQ